MSELHSGLLWLVQPSEKREVELEKAVEYTEGKLGRPVQLISCNPRESFPMAWRDIPVRPDNRILANHIFLVTEIEDAV
jgi:hypothetical protein